MFSIHQFIIIPPRTESVSAAVDSVPCTYIHSFVQQKKHSFAPPPLLAGLMSFPIIWHCWLFVPPSAGCFKWPTIWRQFIELNGLLSVASCFGLPTHSSLRPLPRVRYPFCQPLSRSLLSPRPDLLICGCQAPPLEEAP